MTRVLIVEDQSMPRTLFEMYVNQSENYTLAGSISNADMTDYHCENSDVDLILMDICTSMGANGLEAAERIKAQFPKIKIIIVTSMPEYSYLKRAREAGVDSFWYKEVSPEGIDGNCRVVFKETGFNGSDEVKTNTLLILKQHGITNVATV